MMLRKKLILGLAIFCFYTVGVLETRPLNVLFVVEYFPAPSQPHIINIITGLIDAGHNVTIFSFRKNNVEGHPNIAKYSLMDFVIYGKKPTTLPDVDIVFCQSATLGRKLLEMKSLATWLNKRKMVVCLRGNDITKNSVKNNPRVYQKLFNRCNLFLPVCDYFKRIAMQLGCPAEKIMVHHSAINCEQFFFRERKKVMNEIVRLVSVCRLVEKKGLNFAIEAVARIVKKDPQIHYTIVGDGPDRARLEKLVNQLKIADKITFFGWGTQNRIVNILDESHIFLLPSITAANGDEEGIANALKEAMAMGLITVGTRHAGTPELIENGVSGFLVNEKSSNMLANKITYIIKHSEMWKDIGLAARKKIEDEFETKQSIKELEEIFYRLLG